MTPEKFIKDNEKEIDEKNEELKKKYLAKLEVYCELRKIMENENNHKDKFILNPLEKDEKDKDGEYRRLLTQLKQKDDDYNRTKNTNEEIIQKNFNAIKDLKKELLNKEKIVDKEEKHYYETKKREVLEKTMDLIKNKDYNKAICDKVKNIIESTKK